MNQAELEEKISQLTETTENYLKRIYILTIQYGQARISDIAKNMSRSLSSVTEAVQRMASDGFLHYEKYGKITVTEIGKEIAESILANYSLMNDLLQILGIPEDIAILDACSMEHSISDKTMNTLSNFVEFLQTDPEAKSILKKFKSKNF